MNASPVGPQSGIVTAPPPATPSTAGSDAAPDHFAQLLKEKSAEPAAKPAEPPPANHGGRSSLAEATRARRGLPVPAGKAKAETPATDGRAAAGSRAQPDHAQDMGTDNAVPGRPASKRLSSATPGDDGATQATTSSGIPQDPALREFTAVIGLQPASGEVQPGEALATETATPDLPLARGRAATGHAVSPEVTAAPPDDAAPAPAANAAEPHKARAGSERAQRAHAGASSVPERSAAASTSAAAQRNEPAIGQASGPTFAQTLAMTGRGSESSLSTLPPSTADAPGTLPLASAPLAMTSPATPLAASTETPAPTLRMQADLHSAAFNPELAARVSLLARDGVQHAELQLNPAEMGPVSIEIVVKGEQAHVHFVAAQADTRQALENSLPDLAAALRDTGLTLSGGGVFQQSSRGQTNPDGSDTSGGAPRRAQAVSAPDAIDIATAALSRPPMSAPRGLLDTFA